MDNEGVGKEREVEGNSWMGGGRGGMTERAETMGVVELVQGEDGRRRTRPGEMERGVREFVNP